VFFRGYAGKHSAKMNEYLTIEQRKYYPKVQPCKAARKAVSKMGKAFDVLSCRIVVQKSSADNDNYSIGLSIAEGEAVLAEFKQLQADNKELKAEMREVSNQLNDLHDICNETTMPGNAGIYGTILGLHERLDIALQGKKGEKE